MSSCVHTCETQDRCESEQASGTVDIATGSTTRRRSVSNRPQQNNADISYSIERMESSMDSRIFTPDRYTPRLGRGVLYCLDEQDARNIRFQRIQAGQAARNGNDAHEGDVFYGIIVRDFGAGLVPPEGTTWEEEATKARLAVNIQLFLDGNDSFWVTSRTPYVGKTKIFGMEEEQPQDPRGHWTYAD